MKLVWSAAMALVLGSSTGLIAQQNACTVTESDKTAAVEAIRTMYAAAAADDLAKFHTIVTPDFYIYEGGTRIPGDAMMKMLKEIHAKGDVYVWTVNEPDVHVSCDVAWVAYVNRGSLTDASGTKKVTWLESAGLVKQDGKWRVAFSQSVRAKE